MTTCVCGLVGFEVGEVRSGYDLSCGMLIVQRLCMQKGLAISKVEKVAIATVSRFTTIICRKKLTSSQSFSCKNIVGNLCGGGVGGWGGRNVSFWGVMT